MLCYVQSLALFLRQGQAAQASLGFCSLMRREMAVVALGIAQESRVCKALANVLLVGVPSSARAVEAPLSS